MTVAFLSTARPEPFDSPLILSLSKDERLAQDVPVEGRARGSTSSPRAGPHLLLAVVAALVIWRMKRYYADAAVDDLRWILNPTARLATAFTGVAFEWVPGEGYLSRERFFLIAKVCAGINFMIAAFGMVTWMLRRRVASWRSGAGVLATSFLAAYSAAVVVNAARIAAALCLAERPEPIPGMSATQVHRAEGILFYFGGLLLVHQLVQQFDRRLDHPLATPLIWYYVVTVAIPLANGAAGGSASFVEHTAFVVALPILVVALAAVTSVMYAFFSRVPRCMDPKRSSSAVRSWWVSRAEPVRWPRLRPHNLRR